MSCHLLLNLLHELANMILCEALPSIISFLPTNLRFYLLHNCENYRNIDFSVRNTLVISPYCVISLVKIFIFIEWLYSTAKVYVM